MRHYGKLATLVIVTVAVLATAASLWYHRSRAARPLAWWGVEASVLVARAPRVTVLRLEAAPAKDSRAGAESYEIDGRPWSVRKRADASQARGLVNIRHALLDDGSYEWDGTPHDAPPQWAYALVFSDGQSVTRLFLDFQADLAFRQGGASPISIRPSADALERFVEEQLDAE